MTPVTSYLVLRYLGRMSIADAAGIAVARVRYVHVIVGGAFAGAAGAYLMLVRVPAWNGTGTTDRIGWIALALVVFAPPAVALVLRRRRAG